MNTYNGPAVAVAPDGTEIPTTASLISDDSGRRKSWGGGLGVPDGGDRWVLFNASQATLRMPDGREGQFVASPPADASEFLAITGSGLPPF